MKKTPTLVSTLAFLAVSVSTASPALAGTCTTVGGVQLCGKVTYNIGSTTTAKLVVVDNWPNTAPSARKVALSKGQSSSTYMKDCDGFYVPTGHKAHAIGGVTYGPGWHKINDTESRSIVLYRG